MPSEEHVEVPVDEISSTGDLAEIAERRRLFAELNARKRELATEERKLKKEIAELEEKVLEDYVELGTDSMRVMLGEQRYTVHLAPEVFARPLRTGLNDKGEETSTEEDWERACAALRAVGLGEMIGERFNVRSFGAWVKEFREEHGPSLTGASSCPTTSARPSRLVSASG